MYSTYNEEKSIIAERFIRSLKSKICKYKTSISKNVYTGKLDDIVGEYNNIYSRTIKIKHIDDKTSTYIDFGVEIKINILNLKLMTM